MIFLFYILLPNITLKRKPVCNTQFENKQMYLVSIIKAHQVYYKNLGKFMYVVILHYVVHSFWYTVVVFS